MLIICGLKSIIKQSLDLVFDFLPLKCIIKQLLDSVFVICKIINVSIRVISYLDIDNSAYQKTSPNNCLICGVARHDRCVSNYLNREWKCYAFILHIVKNE